MIAKPRWHFENNVCWLCIVCIWHVPYVYGAALNENYRYLSRGKGVHKHATLDVHWSNFTLIRITDVEKLNVVNQLWKCEYKIDSRYEYIQELRKLTKVHVGAYFSTGCCVAVSLGYLCRSILSIEYRGMETEAQGCLEETTSYNFYKNWCASFFPSSLAARDNEHRE